MNYYIQGNKEKADKIKAAFEELGINVLGFGFADKAVVYCSIGECVQYLPYSINLMNILYSHPDYKELELLVKPKFKVGDFIADNYCKGKVIEITNDAYLLDTGQGIPFSCEHNAHLWTINDAKDGDVLAADECYVIFKEIDGLNIKCYCTYHYMGFNPSFYIDTLQNKTAFHPATQKERYQLFKGMREAGYQWYAGKKELCRIIEPKFKVGDGIKTGNTIDTIAEIDYATRSYCCESGRTIWFENQDLWHLVSKPHYDISNFHAGMPVLVRDGDCDDDDWTYALFSHYNSTRNEYKFSASGNIFSQCIPYNDDTKHLLGTTDMPSEEFINW